MARFDSSQADNYGGTGGGGFFSLKNDKDVAQVRFMYETLDDVEGFSVHEVEVDGKKRYADCLRDYRDPVDVCPFCAARMRVLAKVFVPLFDEESQEVKIWERGKTFFSKLESLTSRYNPLVATAFEIERNGKKGDTSTKYETFALETDDTTLEDLPEVPEILGGLVLDKTAEEMEYYLEHEEFPAEEEDEPVRRKGRKSEPATRRRATPATVETEDEGDYEEEKPKTKTAGRRRLKTSNEDRF